MADELDLLRSADPVPSDDHRFGDGPLNPRAEHRLARLLTGADERAAGRPGEGQEARSGRLRLPSVSWSGRPVVPSLPGARRLRIVWGLLATALLAALTLGLVVSGPSSPPAVAAPRPLVIETGSAPVPLDRLAERAAALAGDQGAPRLRKGTHVQSWSLGMSDDDPPVTLAEERLVRWRPDGSHTELVVATDPRHPGRPVLSDEDGTPRLVDDGHVLLDRTYPPSWSDAPPQSPPPRAPDRLRAYLAETQYTGTPLTTPELLDAVATLLDHWTLGARESAALARLLADTEGLRPAGRVTDRLGRNGQAYVTDDAHGVRRMLIMDPVTGAVLGLESTLTAPDPEYRADRGAVMAYSAWMP
ncbi:CU044_5270 family protein [Streptomyces dubilierae]|uniref:CU044_5270 family protein n=1 Tax=Streptomyces dubilierae TaxID=3075533 RepID=A0ABU2PDU0_9ACTN|nr:CU044_5270 family protein [Streptomyces sp. DSM 41921]MDT0390328.1 CU044_5270 family protein [Streptomyces sp. DSM 41921]